MKNVFLLLAVVSSLAHATSISFDLTSSNSVYYSSYDASNDSMSNETYSVDLGDFSSQVKIGQPQLRDAQFGTNDDPNGEYTTYYSYSYFDDSSMSFNSTPGLEYLRSLDLNQIQTSVTFSGQGMAQRYNDYFDPMVGSTGSESVVLQVFYSGFFEESVDLGVLQTSVGFSQDYYIYTDSIYDASEVVNLDESNLWDRLLNANDTFASLNESFNFSQYLCTNMGCDVQVNDNYFISSYGSASTVNIPLPSSLALFLPALLWLRKRISV